MPVKTKFESFGSSRLEVGDSLVYEVVGKMVGATSSPATH